MVTKKSAVKDLTNGSPVKLILGFALPLLLGMLFQQFYSMVDTIIVGKFLGAKALAAVGSTGSINFMIVGFCMGVCSGFAIPVAQMFGAGDRKALCRYVGNGAVLAGILSVVMTVLVCIWCRDILILMKPRPIFWTVHTLTSLLFSSEFRLWCSITRHQQSCGASATAAPH